ncbi:MAG TPA: Gfo/Idh/MocA family oxidoreductase [Verrucomicrobiales bacterium]|nr:Gfo/Idh/MocA family oxidoreductase [Verrucomicrobiales bacterium]
MTTNSIGVGVIGGGLMGREVASAFARWCALEDLQIEPRLTAVADLNPAALQWFRRVPGIELLTGDYHELLRHPEVDVVYVAVPHHLHEAVYLDVLRAGRDLLAEKPFGIDLAAAQRIASAAAASGRFVRCSSEFPFYPGAQRVMRYLAEQRCGRLLEVVCGFHHSSDLDPGKLANWKRQSQTCGAIGVLGDLGMHTVHLPFRLGWYPSRVFAQLQRGYPERPGPDGKPAFCDTWDNALLHTWSHVDGHDVPLRFEMKRMAPGEMNTWFIHIAGTEGGIRYSTKTPKTLWTFSRRSEQVWEQTDLGFDTPFQTITGGIFEPGFPDVLQQMWAAYLVERDGRLGKRLGCVRPEEALRSHCLFDAALRSQESGEVVAVRYPSP